MHYDVFNGDADGIIALVQLRLATPKNSELITGVKRDIALLERVDSSEASSVTVLDISMEKNTKALNQLLSQQVPVFYADHHRTGEIPESDLLTAKIDTDPNTCTSLIVNQYLNGKYVNWAIAAAFGDNMIKSATLLAEQQGLSREDTQLLSELGVYINYNGYGRSIDDLHFHPAKLFQSLLAFDDPLTLVHQQQSIFTELKSAYQHDMALANSAEVLMSNNVCHVVLLSDEPWARRISGVYGNELANQSPDRAHAVLTKNEDNTYTVSVRAPINNKQGADEICTQFPSGGGRAAAAGINLLPQSSIELFIETLASYYSH